MLTPHRQPHRFRPFCRYIAQIESPQGILQSPAASARAPAKAGRERQRVIGDRRGAPISEADRGSRNLIIFF